MGLQVLWYCRLLRQTLYQQMYLLDLESKFEELDLTATHMLVYNIRIGRPPPLLLSVGIDGHIQV